MLNLKRPPVVWMMLFLYLLNSKISIYNICDQVHVCVNPVIMYSPCCLSLEIKSFTSLGGGCAAASTRWVFTLKHDGHLLLSQPQRLWHRRHTSLRLFLTQPTTTLYFWMQKLTGHIALKSIFFASVKIKKVFVDVHLPSSPVEEPLCDCCPTQSPAPFTYQNEFLPAS